MNSPRMQAARLDALNERLGKVAPRVTADWDSKYTRYVGCHDTDPGKTYPDIESALLGTGTTQGPVLPRTTIKVCEGTYPGNNIVYTSYVAIVGRGDADKVVVDCNLVPDTDNDNDEDGIDLYASYDRVSHLTINNCYDGVLIRGLDHITTNSAVSSSKFHYNAYGIYTDLTEKSSVEDNEVCFSYYYGINAFGDAGDEIEDNTVTNTGLGVVGETAGIGVEFSIKTKVEHNTSNYNYGAGFAAYSTEFNDVESNHFDYNGGIGAGTITGYYSGVYLDEDDGGKYKNNHANHNFQDGFFVSSETGADAPTGQIPDKFNDNSAFDNGRYDYEDDSVSNAPGTNNGTGNYWNDNEGNTAYPPSLIDS